MNHQKILFMGKPSTTINTYGGGITSAIADDENGMCWVYNNYLSIFCIKTTENYFFDNSYWEQYTCPFMFNHMIPREFLHNWGISLKKLIIDSIDLNSYVGLYVDKYYIPDANQYQNDHLVHGMFIYGYDITENIVYCCNNLNNGKFVHIKIFFDDLENAYWNIEVPTVYTGKIHVFRKLSVEDMVHGYDIDPRVIKTGINNYLNSICTMKVESSEPLIFGYDAIKNLISIIQKNKRKPLDIRVFHLLWDHKTIMINRIKYMFDRNLITDGEYFLKSYEDIAYKYLFLRNLVLKFNMSRDTKLLPSVHAYLQEHALHENSILKKMMDSIRIT